MSATVQNLPLVRHEDFCPVVDKKAVARMETFPYLSEDPATGRTHPTHRVTRCLDCGAAHYEPIGA